MKRVAFANIRDPRNLGDCTCNPAEIPEVDRLLREFGVEPVVCSFKEVPQDVTAVVFGGGGMLHPGVDTWMTSIAKRIPAATWGLGLNYHREHGPELQQWHPALKSMAGPVGIRDKVRDGFPETCVNTPCPSCLRSELSDALRTMAATPWGWKARPLILEHHRHPIQGVSYAAPTPRRIRNDCSTGFAEMVRLIACSRAVLTNTFHGGYWSLLLGTPVYMLQGTEFSSRHDTLRDLGVATILRGDLPQIGASYWWNPLLPAHQAAARAFLSDRLLPWLVSL